MNLFNYIFNLTLKIFKHVQGQDTHGWVRDENEVQVHSTMRIGYEHKDKWVMRVWEKGDTLHAPRRYHPQCQRAWNRVYGLIANVDRRRQRIWRWCGGFIREGDVMILLRSTTLRSNMELRVEERKWGWQMWEWRKGGGGGRACIRWWQWHRRDEPSWLEKVRLAVASVLFGASAMTRGVLEKSLSCIYIFTLHDSLVQS